MISRRKFFAITTMMVVIFFMFQFSQVIKDITNKYDVNRHYEDTKLKSDSAYKMESDYYAESDFVVFVGGKFSDYAENTKEWCTYTKRNYSNFKSLHSFYVSGVHSLPEFVVIQAEFFNDKEDIAIINEYLDKGVSIIFCNMPDYSTVASNQELMDLFGIVEPVEEETEVEGIKLFSGFLLGGETIYDVKNKEDEKRQDLELNMPWYKLGKGIKTYMVGLKDESVENEDFPAVIWKHSYEKASVFCVNGNYMKDMMGIGFLQAMASEANAYEIYPVVNAQSLVISNYPSLASENNKQLMEMYSRKQQALFRDIVWPGISALAKICNFKMTMLIAPQIDYTDNYEPTDHNLIEYLKEINEEDAEAGISLEYKRNIALQVKMERDNDFFKNTKLKYEFHAISANSTDIDEIIFRKEEEIMKNVGTMTCEKDADIPLLSYISDNITLQGTISDGVNHKYSDDLTLKSIETILAYSNIHLNMNNIAWPESDGDRWEVYYKEVSKNLDTFWNDFKIFEQTTLSESDAKVRRFLATDFEKSFDESGKMVINVTGNKGDNYFILKKKGKKIKEIKGGEIKEIEEDFYLIHATSDKLVIDLKDTDNLYYVMPD